MKPKLGRLERILVAEAIESAVQCLGHWIDKSDWVGHEPFDGLGAPWARRLTFEVPILRIALQQSVRRLPLNLRSLLGVPRTHSPYAMGYFASGYLRLFQCTGQNEYLDKARLCLADLSQNCSQGYAGHAWGNAFDYQSRGSYLPAGVPTVVWTSFIGYAFVDAFELLSEPEYLEVARSACEFILRNLSKRQVTGQSLCISYVPHKHLEIHNANMLGASLLARVYEHTGEPELLEVSHQAVRYTMDHQQEDGSWYYGQGLRWRWVDGYHTGFVLDALYWYLKSTGDGRYQTHLRRGMEYYRQHLFDGVLAKHYSSQTYPIDIQSVAQAIQSFALIPRECRGDLDWSYQVALWATEHMQDPSGYFHFRRHRSTTDKTPFLHWGQATMLAALSLLILRRRAAREPQQRRDSVAIEPVSTDNRVREMI